MEGGSSLLCSTDKAQFLSVQGCMGGRVRGEEEGASKSLSSLKERDSSRFNDSLSSWLLHLGGKCRPGLAVTGLEKSGPEKIYREIEILTCTWGPKTALAIPARLVFLLRGVDMLWKYILFMKKARLDFPKNSLCSPRCGFAGCSRPLEDVERGARHCKASLSGHGSAKGSICQRCWSLFPPQHFPGSASNSLSQQRQDISHRNATGACRAKDQCSGAWARTEGEREEWKGGEGVTEKVREGQPSRRKCGVDGK